MALSTSRFVIIASLLAHVPTAVILIIGAVIVLLGIMRFLKLVPRLSLNTFRRSDNPIPEGSLIILVGVIVLILGMVR